MALVRKTARQSQAHDDNGNNLGDTNVTLSTVTSPSHASDTLNQSSHFSPSFDKIASGRVHESLVVASIDKLTLLTNYNPPNLEELQTQAKKSFRGDGYTLLLDEEAKNSLWFTSSIGETGGLRISLNPSKFSSAWEVLEVIEEHFGKAGMNATVKRLDCAITFPESFDEVFMGLDFGNKRSVECWRDRPKGRSFYVGRKDNRHELVVYDKSKQLNSLKEE